MNNAFKVFLRDLRRFARAPQAIVIIIGIIITPSLYAWINIIAFWDPYNDTEHINVAIVNEDTGASNPVTGEVDVGEQVVEQLKTNKQLGWQFLDRDEAMKAVKSGEAYAAIVINKDFSSDLLTIMTPTFTQPEIEYYVNEKVNAIAPKITDVGATTVETQINSTFVSTVSETIAQTLEKEGVRAGDKLSSAQSSSEDALATAEKNMESARKGLTEMGKDLTEVEKAMGDATAALNSVNSTIDEVQVALSQTQSIVTEVNNDIIKFTDSLTKAFVLGSADLTKLSGTINGSLSTVLSGVNQANAVVGSAVKDASAVVEKNGEVISSLSEVADSLDPADPLVERLNKLITNVQERNDSDKKLLNELSALNKDVTDVTDNIQTSADAMNDALSDSSDASVSIRKIMTDTVPELNRAMNALSASAGGFSSALDAQKVLANETLSLIDDLSSQLKLVKETGGALNDNITQAETTIDHLRDDLATMSAAEIWKDLEALTSLDPTQISKFMAAPVTVKEHAVFPVSTYGSAMAPLFTNLSLWIAAFVLVVLLKQEVDTEGVEGVTMRQAYMGRWMLFAAINFFQALLVSVGNIVIGVQMANAFAYVATSIFVGFVYLAVIYALAVSFGYVGKGAAILLVIMQIPGASGIYPIEMMPQFFRSLFPFFPFTYGINAMRETIGGFYHLDYWRYIAVLALFAALGFTLGLFFRQRLGNFSRLFNRELSDTHLFVSEDVQILGSRKRVTQLIQALTNRQEFLKRNERQAQWFHEHHVTVLRLTVIAAFLLTCVLLGISWFVPAAKATILGIWGVLCFATIAVVVALEYIKQNVTYGASVGDLSADELQAQLEREERATHSNTKLDALKEGV